MSKSDLGVGLGMATAIAICCGAHLLVLAVAAWSVALLTGQIVVMAAAAALLLGIIGGYVWRRHSGRCPTRTCSPADQEVRR